MALDIAMKIVGRSDDYENEKTLGYMSSKSSIDNQCPTEGCLKKEEGFFTFKTEIIWTNAISITLLHLVAVYCLLTFDYLRDWRTLVWGYVMYIISGTGVIGGVHRYWTHRTYKAKKPFQVFLILCYAAAGQNRIFNWVRDHRIHHKYTDTDADPHNSYRGFFFSHMGWLMLRKHPEVLEKGRQIDMSDIKNDSLLLLADKYFTILRLVLCFLLPTMVPVYGWGETWARAFISQGILRYVIVLNCTWSVNSAAHIWGTKPYDKSIKPRENVFVSYIAGGEGWHNYHHVFPWDYKASEWGGGMHNLGAFYLNTFAKFGWVYDLKEPSQELINAVAKRRGEGSRAKWEEVAPEASTKSRHIIITEEKLYQ